MYGATRKQVSWLLMAAATASLALTLWYANAVGNPFTDASSAIQGAYWNQTQPGTPPGKGNTAPNNPSPKQRP